jgi:hypothetical protein
LSWTTWAALVLLAAPLGLAAVDRLTAAFHRLRDPHESENAARAWSRYRTSWLGLTSRLDEAASALNNSIR